MDATLPHLDDCLDVYRTAYQQHGTASFTIDEFNWNHPDGEADHVVDLTVAYGLLTTDGTVYKVSYEPNNSVECWEALVGTRAERLSEATNRVGDMNDKPRTQSITYKNREYAGVRVADGDDFVAVSESIDEIELDRWTGIVLRAPGEYASVVQQFADRLCDPRKLSDLPLKTTFQKEHSDVKGSSKDQLEFRLFLGSQ